MNRSVVAGVNALKLFFGNLKLEPFFIAQLCLI